MYQHAVCDGLITTYMMQPGDATRYSFSLIPVEHYGPGIGMGRGGSYDTAEVGDVITGVNQNYVTLFIHSSFAQGSYEFSKLALAQPWENYFYDYAQSKMRHVDEYTLKAILLAVSVLVNEPDNLEQAGKKMLLMKDDKWREENDW